MFGDITQSSGVDAPISSTSSFCPMTYDEYLCYNNILAISDVDIKRMQVSLDDKMVSEFMTLNDVYSFVESQKTNLLDFKPSKLLNQLTSVSSILDLLSNNDLTDYLKIDSRVLYDIAAQAMLSLKLLSYEANFQNFVLIFMSCIMKFRLPRDIEERALSFIQDSVKSLVHRLCACGYKSEAVFDNLVDVLSSSMSKGKETLESEIIVVLAEFISKISAYWAIVSSGFTQEDFNLSAMPRLVEHVQSLMSDGEDIFSSILSGYLFITKNFTDFLKGDFSGIPLTKREASSFESQVAKIVSIYSLVKDGSFEILKTDYDMTEDSFDLQLARLIKTGDNLLKKSKPAQKPALKRMQDELRAVQVDRQVKQAQVQSKVSALGICFVGPSGVGKSVLMEQTARVIIKASGTDPEPEMIVTGQMSDKFDSNELPQHLVLMYDDVANNSGNENADKLLNAINSQARPFLKASVEEKGSMFPRNVGCVISTNVPGFNAQKSNCPDSIARRFLHIEVSLKDNLDIYVPGTKRIDPTKTKGTLHMDIWKFNVYEFVTFTQPEEGFDLDSGIINWKNMYVRPVKWTDKPIEEQSYWDLARWIGNRAKNHFASQKDMIAELNSRQSDIYCNDCCLPESVCECHESEFLTDMCNDGVNRVIMQYDIFSSWASSWWSMTKFRAVVALAFLLMPNSYKRFSIYVSPIILVPFLCTDNIFVATLSGLSLFILALLFMIKSSYCQVRQRMANTPNILRHLAVDTVTAVNQYRNKIFIGLGAVAVSYAFYRTFRPKSEFLSFKDTSIEYVKPNMARSEKARTTLIGDLIPNVKKDVGKIEITSNDKTTINSAFPIESNFFLTVGHAIPKSGEFTVRIVHENESNPTVAKQIMSNNNVYSIPNTDLVILHIPSAIPRRGYKKYLLCRSAKIQGVPVKHVSLNPIDGTRTVQDTHMAPYWSKLTNYVSTDKVRLYRPYKYRLPSGSALGMCGSVLVDYSKSIIYGFHVAGNGPTGLCQLVTQEDINEALSSFKGFIPANSGELHLGSQTLEKGRGHLEMTCHDESMNKPVDEHNLVCEGILPGASATFKHPYVHHPYIDAINKEIGNSSVCPPKEINSNFHKRKALNNLSAPNQEFALDEVEFALDDYINPVEELIASYSPAKREELARPLSLQEALDGISEQNLQGIDNSTSVGFPYKGKKKDYLARDPADPNIPVTPRQLVENHNVDFIEEVSEMEKVYSEGRTFRPLFKCSMKTNELLPNTKVKARIFMGCNLPFLLLARKFLAPYIRVVTKNRFLFESGKGINMDSVECEELYNFLKVEDGERTVALDYTAFDQTMSAQISTAVCAGVIRVLRALGCSERHITIARGLLTDIVYPNLHFFGTILQLANSDPSGNPITTELNGGVNSLYLRIFFFRIYPEVKNKITYRQAIRTMTYGDDNINGVPAAYSKFNGVNIVAEGKNVGLKITMADKGAEVTEFTHLESSDFLKRKFRFCEDLGHWRAPLSKTSIWKSLHWMKKTSPEPPEILFSQNVDGIQRKSSQYGRDYFEESKRKLRNIAETHNVVHICHWWDYDALIKHDRENYYDHYNSGSSIFETDDYQSESFVRPARKITFDFSWIFTIIADIFLSLIPFVKTGRFTDIKTNVRQYYSALAGLIISYYAIPEPFAGGDKSRWANLGFRLRNTFVNLWITQENDIIRPQPYCLCLEGPAGVGKTTCALALIKELYRDKGGIHKSEIVILNEDDDFQSEFRSHHKVVILDDVANTAKDMMSQSPLRRIIDFVNNIPKRALHPEAELKGAIKIQPELVIVTSNVRSLTTSYFTVNNDSILRRIDFVLVEKKPNYEFKTNVLDISGWNITAVGKVKVPLTNDKYDGGLKLDYDVKSTARKFLNFSEAVYHYTTAFDSHRNQQDQLVKVVNDYFDDNSYKSESLLADMSPNLLETLTCFIRRAQLLLRDDIIGVLVTPNCVVTIGKDSRPDTYYPLSYSGLKEARNIIFMNSHFENPVYFNFSYSHCYITLQEYRDYFEDLDTSLQYSSESLELADDDDEPVTPLFKFVDTVYHHLVLDKKFDRATATINDLQGRVGEYDSRIQSLTSISDRYRDECCSLRQTIIRLKDENRDECNSLRQVIADLELSIKLQQDKINDLLYNCSKSDSDISMIAEKEPRLKPFVAKKTKFPFSVKVSSDHPSDNERKAQEKAIRQIEKDFPSWVLVACEVFADEHSCDLIFKEEDMFIFVEAKAHGPQTARKQAARRVSALRIKYPKTRFSAYYYAESTGILSRST